MSKAESDPTISRRRRRASQPSTTPTHVPDASPRKPRRRRIKRVIKARRLRRGYKPRLRGVPRFLRHRTADVILTELVRYCDLLGFGTDAKGDPRAFLFVALPGNLLDALAEYGAAIEDHEDSGDEEETCDDEGNVWTDDEEGDPAEDNGDREPQCEDEGAQCDDEGAIETDLGADDHGEASLVSAENASLSTYSGLYDLEASLVPAETAP